VSISTVEERGHLAGASFLEIAAVASAAYEAFPLAPARCRQHRRQRLSEAMVNEAGRRAAALTSAPEGASIQRPRLRLSKASAAANDTGGSPDVFPHPQEPPPSRWCATWPRWPSAGWLVSFEPPINPLAARAENRSSASPRPQQEPPTRLHPARDGKSWRSGKRQDSTLRRSLNTCRQVFTSRRDRNLPELSRRRQGGLQRQLLPPRQ